MSTFEYKESSRCEVNLPQIWQATLGTMQMQIPRQDFETWLRNTSLISLDNGIATIGTPSLSNKEGMENRYMAPLRRSLGEVVGFPVQVRIIIAATPNIRGEPVPPAQAANHTEQDHDKDKDRGAKKPEQPPPTSAPYTRAGNANSLLTATDRISHTNPLDFTDHHGLVQLDLSGAMRAGMLNPKYTFSRFVVGSSNRLAHAACLAVADHPAMAYNPLFLYGGVGLGKTHLLHAIGNSILDRDPEINVLYVSSEKFTNDLINAIRRQQNEEFRIRYRNIDVLLIDDIQFIAGKDATQEEFFHTFNTLHSATKQIVMSSDRPPKAIITLEERLRSRFEWGLIVDIQPPDLETRTAILRAKGEQLNLNIPSNVVDFIAMKIQSNIRELEGSLNRVAAYAEMNMTSITIDVAVAALSELLDDSRRKRIAPETIIQTVSEYYGIETGELLGRGRNRTIVIPRQVAMYLLREETDTSLVEIGAVLGGRDHTTVMHGCEKIADEINKDSRLRSDILSLREKLYQDDE